MARFLGPDENTRLVYVSSGGNLRSAVGKTAVIYADSAATTLADIRTEAGAAVAGSQLVVDAYSKIPIFQFPDGADTVYARINSGPIVALYASTDEVAAALAVRLVALEAGGVADALLVHLAGDETVSGVKTFSTSPVVPDPVASGHAATKGYVDTTAGAAADAVAADIEGLWIPAPSFLPLAGSPAVVAGAVVPVMALDSSSIEIIGASFRTPASWLTASLTLWVVNTSSASPGVARMNPFVYIKGPGEAFASGTQEGTITTTVDITLGSTSNEVVTAALGTINCQPSKVCSLRLQRNATSGSDTLAVDLGVVGCMVQRAT